MSSKGVLVYARNNSQIDYIKQAYFLANRVKKYLDLPTSIVTDSLEYLEYNYPDYRNVFDRVIPIVWKVEDKDVETVLSLGENHPLKSFYDGGIVSKKLDWKNNLRSTAFEATPYDETLLLDTDIVICNDIFKKSFEQDHDFLIYKECTELTGINRGDEFCRISDTSVDFYWATAIFFRKTEKNRIFFNLTKHIQTNWQHYCSIFQLNTPYFRNDYVFSIAIHIMNGYQKGDFSNPMPGKLYFVTDKSIMWQINDQDLLLLLEKPKHTGEYTPVKVKGCNVHCMNKFSLNRCIDNE